MNSLCGKVKWSRTLKGNNWSRHTIKVSKWMQIRNDYSSPLIIEEPMGNHWNSHKTNLNQNAVFHMPCIIQVWNSQFLGYQKYKKSNKQLVKIMDPSRVIKHNDADANSSSGSWDIILAEVSSVFAVFTLFPHINCSPCWDRIPDYTFHLTWLICSYFLTAFPTEPQSSFFQYT